MPKSTVEEEPPFKLPKGEPLPAILSSVKEEAITYTIKKGSRAGEQDTFYKWVWEFQITEGDYAPLRAWGETEAKVSNHPSNRARQWIEAIRNAPLGVGEEVDTDDILGLPCFIEVDNVVEERGHKTYYRTPIVAVYSADESALAEPPF